jgi:glycosyltransferase involved in cell wall biosynthesis
MTMSDQSPDGPANGGPGAETGSAAVDRDRSGPAGTERAGTWCWTHVTQPLCTDGSALNNVIRELSREAAKHGIPSAVAASDHRDYVFPDTTILPVNYTAYLPREYLLEREQIADAALGRLGLRRRYVGRMYRPVAEALDASTGPVIVHDGFLGAAGLMAIHRRHPNRPLFLYVHNNLSKSYSRSELRRFLSLTDGVICVSGAVRDTVAEQVGNHPVRHRIHEVLNGIDSDRFHPGAPSPRPVPAVLFVGMMNESKGPHVLMAALRQVHQRGVPFTATFLGSSTHAEGLELSTYEQSLRQAQQGLGPDVRFRPFVPNTEIPDIYRHHDVLVVPSQFEEPCGLVLLEGMASGLAAAASKRGGMPEVGAGAVEYFDGADQLAAVLDRWLADPAERVRRGQMARERAVELPWSASFAKLQDIIGSG